MFCRFFLKGTALFIVAVCSVGVLLAGGCAPLPPGSEAAPAPSARLNELDEHAASCYARGLAYMEQYRYELARQQFAIAASSAVSKPLYNDAVDGMRRAEQIIHERR
ncbi:MAG: hypothetical protein HY885_12225 [Deltaproteobacteria bacterium]|nr:hypothetical protein [Deltaproteobacteria bacterium]